MYKYLIGAIPSRKCSIKAPAKWRKSVYVLTEICHQRSKWLGPKYEIELYSSMVFVSPFVHSLYNFVFYITTQMKIPCIMAVTKGNCHACLILYNNYCIIMDAAGCVKVNLTGPLKMIALVSKNNYFGYIIMSWTIEYDENLWKLLNTCQRQLNVFA